MSWSHYELGPAPEVARKVQKDAESIQKYLQGDEKALHARIVAIVVVACESMKDQYVSLRASGHGGGYNSSKDWVPGMLEQTISFEIHPIAAPVQEPVVVVNLQEPEPVPEAVTVQEPAVIEPPAAVIQEPAPTHVAPAKKPTKRKS